MISKSCVFFLEGGLLVNTTAIFASISSDVVVHEDLHKFRNQINQIYWDCCCSYEECYLREDASHYNEHKDSHWILEPKYKDSRTKVIGKAIADCVTGENEFKDKNAADIITFEGTKPETYKQKHWNAVILYNYIHAMINEENSSAKVKKVLKYKLGQLKTYYGNQYNEDIDKAVAYIQDYVYALVLYDELVRFRESKQKYDNESIEYIAPWVDAGNSDEEKLKFKRPFFQFDKGVKDKRWLYYPTFGYEGDQLYISGVKIIEENWDQNANEGKGVWGNPAWSSYRDMQYRDMQDIKQHGAWLFERLERLVKSPNEKLLNE